MKRMRAMLVAGVLVSGVALAGSSAAGAAPRTAACDRGDKAVAVTAATAVNDLNGNGLVCEHVERYHAPKKPGPGTPSYSYYDDRI